MSSSSRSGGGAAVAWDEAALTWEPAELAVHGAESRAAAGAAVGEPAGGPGSGDRGAAGGGAASGAGVEAALEEAFARGVEAGRAEAERGLAAAVESAVRAAERVAAAVQAGEAARGAAVRDDIAALAVAVARHVVGRQIDAAGPELIADLVRRALLHFPADQPVRVRVHPVDLSLLTTGGGPAGGPVPVGPSRETRWIADPNVERGGCVVEGRERVVDGRVDVALERAYKALVDG